MPIATQDFVPLNVHVDEPEPGGSPELLGPDWIFSGKVPCLDGLRALSILFVLIAHAARTPGFPGSYSETLIYLGPFGVRIFFAISGFLITLLFMREARRSGQIHLRSFYLRRVLRLMPAYASFLAVVFVLDRQGQVALSSVDWLAALTYTVGLLPTTAWEIGHLWSLSLEEQFYLGWPLLILIFRFHRVQYVALAFFALIAALQIGTSFHASPVETEGLNPFWFLKMDAIVFGCVVALFSVHPRVTRITERCKPYLAWICLALVVMMAGSFVLARLSYKFRMIHSIVDAILSGGFIWVVCNGAELPIGRLLESRPLVSLGILSYSLYLWQQLFLNWNASTWPCRWPTNILLTFATAAVCHLLVERPFLRWKNSSALTARI